MVLARIFGAIGGLLLLLPLKIIRRLFYRNDEAYAHLDHLAFNVTPPQSEWMNMGNWISTDEFPTACRNLADLLYQEAGLSKGATVLDVGHGCGDSLLLIAKTYRPTLLHGVTSIPAQAERAQERLRKSSYVENIESKVICGDVLNYLREVEGPKYDFIFALDCAYHFRNRKNFLKLCTNRLNPGGKIALIDLVASHPSPSIKCNAYYTPSPSLPAPKQARASLTSRMKHKFVTLISGVPIENLIAVEDYHSDLYEAGFIEITIKDTSHLVFPGFAKYFQGFGKGKEAKWRGGGSMQARALRSFGSIVQEWSEGGDKGMVRSVLVVAQKAK